MNLGLVKDFDFKDFKPETQDAAALKMIQRDKQYKDGTFMANMNQQKYGEAAKVVSNIWTSLPTGTQEKMTTSEFDANFKKNLSNELKGSSIIATPKGKLKI